MLQSRWRNLRKALGRITAEIAPGTDHPTLDSIKTTQHSVLFSLVKFCEGKESGRGERGRAIERVSETESHNVLQAPAHIFVTGENDLAEWTPLGAEWARGWTISNKGPSHKNNNGR